MDDQEQFLDDTASGNQHQTQKPEQQPVAPGHPGNHKGENPLQTPPPFTLKMLRDAVPAHCFERSALRSFSYVAFDLLHAFLLFFLASHIDSFFLGDGAASDSVAWTRNLLRWGTWMIYWFYQGVVLTGLWVCAHECGHQAFSDSQTLNDAVGLVLHTCLLVPYHPWRISHAKHHMNTGHLERDEVFVPRKRSEVGNHGNITSKFLRSTPVVIARIFLMLFVGWPAYLLLNVAGRKYEGGRPNHFSPSSPIFSPKDRGAVLLSDAALVAWLGVLATWGAHSGVAATAKLYVAPYLFVNMWLVLITCLQHTDVEVPHFKGDEWTWLRGALCTVDRDYGAVLNFLFHHIGDTHICHHIFSKIPHYHAQEATQAIKPILAEYYRRDETPIAVALWRSFAECVFVEDDVKIAWYKSE